MSQRYLIPNLSNAVAILELLADASESVSLGEICDRVRIPKTSAFRILSTLCHEGMAVKEGKAYVIGPRFVRLGLRAVGGVEIRKMARPFLNTLTHRTGETSHLATRSGHSVLVLEVCESPNPLKTSSPAGTLLPLHCTSIGKVILAFDIRDRLSEFLEGRVLEKKTDRTLDTAKKLAAECARIVEQGYALDDQEFFESVRCLAAPVFDARGTLVAALGITATTLRFKKSMVPRVAQAVTEAAGELSRSLGA